MKKRVSPGFYNSDMESKYFSLYLLAHKIKRWQKKGKGPEECNRLITRFELQYYKVSKMNRILNDLSKNKDEIIKYLEPSGLKRRVESAAKEFGIKPYDELDKREEEFIFV